MALKERHYRQARATAFPLLAPGETIEMTTFANVGSVSLRRKVLTAAVVGMATMGSVIVTVRPRPMYLVVTDQRLLFFDCRRPDNRTGELLVNLPRAYLTASEPKKAVFGLALVTTLSLPGSDQGLKLTFPAPCHPHGRQLLASLPVTA